MPRSRIKNRARPRPAIEKLILMPDAGPPEKIVTMTVDAAYFYVLMESGKLNIGHRAQRDEPGIIWSEGEPVPGTVRAREIATLRAQFAKQVEEGLARGEAKDKA